MVLINDKKYSCATCVKGHRSSSCTHTDRPLFEVKKKGRPISQCEHCRLLRTTKQLHVKCQCSSKSNSADPTSSGSASASSASSTTSSHHDHRRLSLSSTHSSSHSASTSTSFPQLHNLNLHSNSNPSTIHKTDVYPSHPTRMILDDTRKGVPGQVATFPNGLKDVHAMNDAAGTLAGFLMGGTGKGKKGEAGAMRVNTLLNPCRCQAGFQCRCCHGPSAASVAPALLRNRSSQSTTPSEGYLSTDDSVSQASSLSRAGSSRRPSNISPSTRSPASGLLEGTNGNGSTNRAILPGPPQPRHLDEALQGISPHHRQHPAHVDPHVHKTQLFSPYRTSSSGSRGSHGHSSASHKDGGLSRNPSSKRSASSRISGSASQSEYRYSEPEREREPYPTTFDLPVLRSVTASNAHVPLPSITFPLTEGISMQGCTCSDDCACPGCAVHAVAMSDPVGIPERKGSGSKPSSHCGTPTLSNPCPESCNSCFDCSRKFQAPMETESILELMSLAAAAMPHPHAGTMPVDMGSTLAAEPINLMNASGPVRSMNMANGFDGFAGDAARKRPEAVSKDYWSSASMAGGGCCDGRCQCPSGQCACLDDCCGCCLTCPCAAEAEFDAFSLPGVKGGCCSSERDRVWSQPPTVAPSIGPDIREEEDAGGQVVAKGEANEQDDEDENDLTIDRFDTIQPDSYDDGGRARFDEALLSAENAFNNDPTAWAESVANGGGAFLDGVGINPGINFWDPTGSSSHASSEVGEEYLQEEQGEEDPQPLFADTLEAQLEALGLPWALAEGEPPDGGTEPGGCNRLEYGH